MRLSAATVGLLLGLSLVLGACGETRTTAAHGPPGLVSRAESTSEGAAAEPSHTPSCQGQLGPFVASLTALRDDLAHGLSYGDYLARVRRARAVYAEIDANRVAVGCLLASGSPAERAFNFYIDAANAWGDCLATVSCGTRSIEPRLQRKWAFAASRVAVARRGLSSSRSG